MSDLWTTSKYPFNNKGMFSSPSLSSETQNQVNQIYRDYKCEEIAFNKLCTGCDALRTELMMKGLLCPSLCSQPPR